MFFRIAVIYAYVWSMMVDYMMQSIIKITQMLMWQYFTLIIENYVCSQEKEEKNENILLKNVYKVSQKERKITWLKTRSVGR
jgi:hypothetical protein